MHSCGWHSVGLFSPRIKTTWERFNAQSLQDTSLLAVQNDDFTYDDDDNDNDNLTYVRYSVFLLRVSKTHVDTSEGLMGGAAHTRHLYGVSCCSPHVLVDMWPHLHRLPVDASLASRASPINWHLD